jgi:rhamnose transport system ATP-binding protein
MKKPILELENISKSFSGVEVLHNVSFSLSPGQVHAILGENGAGKSTLIKIITGYHQPNSGKILLENEPVYFHDTRSSRMAGIAAIYQELSLFPDLDVAENIFIGRHPLKAGRSVDWRKLYEESGKILASLGIDLDLKQKARNLSIAQQQIVEIARAFSINARILIMDEPTSSLTLNEVEELFRLVRNLKEKGTAIIFISHRLEELFQLADCVTVLRDGSYIGTRDMKDVTREELIQMMVGRPISSQYPKTNSCVEDVLLRVENLTQDGVFTDISFELHCGEILGLAGLVGAGRTEVARVLFGVEQPTNGKICVDGNEVTIKSPQEAIRLGISYVPEDRGLHGLIPDMNISSNISLPLLESFTKHGWINTREERNSTFASTRQMEVRAKHIWQLAKELSGGNQQKVVLAKWLSTKPRILILDEPTRGIDVGTKAAVHQLMNELAAEGIGILMISSELPEILGMSDRVVVMREGHLTEILDRNQATQEKIITAATLDIEKEKIQ